MQAQLHCDVGSHVHAALSAAATKGMLQHTSNQHLSAIHTNTHLHPHTLLHIPTYKPVRAATCIITPATLWHSPQSGSGGRANVQLVLLVAHSMSGRVSRCGGSLVLPRDTKGMPWRAASASKRTALATITSCCCCCCCCGCCCWFGVAALLLLVSFVAVGRNSEKGCVAILTVCTS